MSEPPLKGIRVIGRNTQGVRLINLDNGDAVIDVARVMSEAEEAAVAEAAVEPVVDA
jgi:DNA gyrase subunit A